MDSLARRMAGQKESEGPLGNTFDQILEDDLLGQKSWEFAESEMLRRTVELCASKANLSPGDIGALLAGDLNAQIISAGFAARQLGVPFLGLYGACSTMTEALVVGAAAGVGRVSQKCHVRGKQPFLHGGAPVPRAAGNGRAAAALGAMDGHSLGRGAAGRVETGGMRVTHGTVGRVIDLKIKDANHMGAAMAPRRGGHDLRAL